VVPLPGIMDKKELFEKIGIDKNAFSDLHVSRFYSAYVAVSKGKVINVTENPRMEYCPLACYLYGELRESNNSDKDAARKVIKKIVERKISEFGFFTENRELSRSSIAIPYGASEILMYAMRNGIVDAAVVVCDGAGTVIVEDPEVVQGIGARMNGLFYTTPIESVMERLGTAGCRVVFEDASIDQIEGVRKAAALGYSKIAVTVNGSMDESLKDLYRIENDNGVTLTSLAVCTTGISTERTNHINEYADMIWSCASEEVREMTGKKAILQLSRKIPVFVLTGKGLDLLSGYCSKGDIIKNLDVNRQYLVASDVRGDKMRMGAFGVGLTPSALPVRDEKEPRFSVEVLIRKDEKT
jgi:putative methanogenesis marker protein 8